MGILAIAADERVAEVSFEQDSLCVRLKDGRTISAPLAWFPRLFHATREQRQNWEIAAADTAYTGRKLTRTSAPRACSVERPLHVPNQLESHPRP